MEISRKEKAIEQAQASLRIDGISLNPEFLISFKIRKGIPEKKTQSLTLKRSITNDKRSILPR